MDTSTKPGVTTIVEVAAADVESSGKRSLMSASEEFTPCEIDQRAQVTTQGTSPTRDRRGGGPRTAQGKQKSKHNALKHGIFSQVVLMRGESRTEYDFLLSGLRTDLEPEGTLEELLVDKAAVLFWRLRRLIIAERDQPKSHMEITLISIKDELRPPPLDLLLRYESNLERAIERALNQLERRQRIRKGETVLPTLNVNVST
jgi:hypothetical protein